MTLGAVAPDPSPFLGLSEPDQQQQDWSLEGIVKPDSYVQFFLMPEPKEAQSTEVIEDQEGFNDAARYSLTVFGSVPRPLDQIQAPAWAVSKVLESKDFIYFRGGHFGAVSESGLFLTSSAAKDESHGSDGKHSEQTLVKSKVNAPFSYFYRDRRSQAGMVRDWPASYKHPIIRKVGIQDNKPIFRKIHSQNNHIRKVRIKDNIVENGVPRPVSCRKISS